MKFIVLHLVVNKNLYYKDLKVLRIYIVFRKSWYEDKNSKIKEIQEVYMYRKKFFCFSCY